MSSVLFLATQVYESHGGVQAYMRRIAEIVSAYGAGKDFGLDCISLCDSSSDQARHSHPVRYASFTGARGSKLRFARTALRIAAAKRPTVAVVGHLGLAPIAWMLKRLGLIRSYVLVLHGIEAWRRADALDRVAARGADRVLATTRFTALEFCKYNDVQLERVRVIPLALPELPPEFQKDEPSSVHHSEPHEDGLRVLTVGRLAASERYKGVDTLIEALDKTRTMEQKIRLRIVGDGDDLPRLREQVARLHLDDAVSFEGAIPDKSLRTLYRECDVLAMPSEREGFGIVFLEAMGHAKPCIGGNHGGTPEVIHHGVDGFLVQYGDVDQLAGCLVAFSENPDLRQTMGQNGCNKVKSRFSFQRVRESWFDLLDEVTAE